MPAYVMARALFVQPEIHDPAELNFKWVEPNEAGLEAFLIDSLGFNPDRVKSGIAKLKASRGAMQQKRLDSFFKPSGSSSTSSTTLKRKEAPAAAKGKGKAKFGGKKK
ncbi:flap endonuclease 1 [Nannochloropsis gaditana CCMP526]|nr:flap endonuclease 1 [Nannochloropsis gaditana CCMP526]EKU22849.1 flap endonuclease 1 [Nannochloropsis gaditana CCMP526]|eukprot:XP_005853507.1 flap endonuclease 1 [Nannochloropsis gaditana CCMP526]